MKKAIIAAMIATMTIANPVNAANRADVNRTARDLPIYNEIAQAFDDEIALPEKVFNTDDLTYEILTNRVGCGYVVVEKLIGVCENEKGDGVVINTKDKAHDYISYRHNRDYCTGQRIHTGDVVLTYLIYNPNTTWIDDVVERVDYIIDTATFN